MSFKGKVARFLLYVKFTLIVNLIFTVTPSQGQYLPQSFQAFPTNTNVDECRTANIPCGGHTHASCLRYCNSAGFFSGSCDGPCCLCSNSEIGQTSTSSLGYNDPSTLTSETTNLRHKKQLQGQNSSIENTAYFNRGGGYGGGDASIFPDLSRRSDPYANLIIVNDPKILPTKASPLSSLNGYKESFTFNSKNNISPFSAQKDVCSTHVCHDEAEVIKRQMDERADPCDDFYQFACGGFIRQHSIGRDEVEVTHFSLLRDKVAWQLGHLFEEKIYRNEAKPFQLVKTMYKSCMNTPLIERQGFLPLLQVLEDVGGWAVLQGDSWVPQETFKWENFVVWYREMGFGLDYFMKISVEPDLRNVGKRFITIGEPGLGISDQVLKRGLNEPVVSAYYNFMTDMAILMGAERARAKREMLDVVNFEINLSKCFYRHDNSRTGNFYNPMTIQQLSSQYPFIPWLEFFQRIVPSKIHITRQEIIMVSVPQYIDCFFNLLRNTEQKTMVNYVVWRAISASVGYLHEAARTLQQNFVSTITGQKDRKPRWRECTEIVQEHMGNAVGAMYIRRFFNDASKAQAMEMVNDIQKAFLDILKENDWMDSFTKGKAREKALEMLVHIGYPEEHKSDAKITPIYAPFNFKEDYFGNVRSLVAGSYEIQFGRLREPIRRNEWQLHGRNAVVNAFYQPQENSIQFPAGILQGHFFNASRPKYLNYASIGWIMGHEITHGFDDQGHQFDKNGNHLNWWAESTKQTYNHKKQCIIDQYNGFQTGGIRLNGDRSQGENIADNGGIKQAYRGYKYWVGRNGPEKGLPGLKYTPAQLFWISSAQNWCSVQRSEQLRHNILTGVHSPAEFRVRGTFSNSEQFSREFKCQAGRKMNPAKKCSVW